MYGFSSFLTSTTFDGGICPQEHVYCKIKTRVRYHSALEVPLPKTKTYSKTKTTQWKPYIWTLCGPSFKMFRLALFEKSQFEF